MKDDTTEKIEKTRTSRDRMLDEMMTQIRETNATEEFDMTRTSNLRIRDVLDVVMMLTSTDFDKSMTTHADNRIWQDVYKPSTSVGDVYLKLTVIDEVLIVSFKER